MGGGAESESVADLNRNGWRFCSGIREARLESKVRALCLKWYGTDGTGVDELVDIRLTFLTSVLTCKGPVTAFGRILGLAKGRYSGAQLGTGVVIESGNIISSGSHSNWETRIESGTVVLLLDVPKALVVAGGLRHAEVQIVEPDQPSALEPAALASERDRLLARVAQIDALLSATPACE